jgi:virginiamycin B lyase
MRDPDALLRIDPGAESPATSLLTVESPLLREPDGIWSGADGGIWFANSGADSIGRLDPLAPDPATTLETFGGPPSVEAPFDIKAGPDDWLWFTNQKGNSIARIYAGE